MHIIMGQNILNSEYFCLYYECNIKFRHNMDFSWSIIGNIKGIIIFFFKKKKLY